MNLLDFFKNLPNPLKFILVLLVGLIVTVGIFHPSDFLSIFNQPQTNELIEVQILIESEENQPIQDVEVQFTTQGPPESKYTNSSGYAQINIPSRNQVDITLSKKGYQTKKETINIKTDPDRNKIFKLKRDISSLEKSIIYSHYTIENKVIPQTLSLLDSGFEIPVIKKTLSQYLGIKTPPQVLQNIVFKTIERFKSETGNNNKDNVSYKGISYVFSDKDIIKRGSFSYETKSESKIITESQSGISDEYSQGETPLVQTTTEMPFIFAPVLSPFLATNEDSEYTTFLEKDILQFPKLSDVKKNAIRDSRWNETIKDVWIQKVLENNPDTRGFLGFGYSYFPSEVSKNKLKNMLPNTVCQNPVMRVTPSPYIKFLDVKNTIKTPLKIEGISYKIIDNNPYKLTVADKRNSLFSGISNEYEELNLFLEPEKHLLIPIEFGFDSAAYENIYNVNYKEINKEKIMSLQSLYVAKPYGEGKKEIEQFDSDGKLTDSLIKIIADKPLLEKNFVQNSRSLDELLGLIPRRMSVGSILNVSSIRIDGFDMEVSPPQNEPLIFISEDIQTGSCPFLLMYNSEKKYWLEMGTILTDINQEKLQQEKIYNLDAGTSQIKIEERESEITYIDSLSILYTFPNSPEVHQVVPSIPELKDTDKSYFTLHKGESLDINFKNFLPANAANIKLKINGYYKTIENFMN